MRGNQQVLARAAAVKSGLDVSFSSADQNEHRSSPKYLETGSRSPFPWPFARLMFEGVLLRTTSKFFKPIPSLDDADRPRLNSTYRWRRCLYGGPYDFLDQFMRYRFRSIRSDRASSVHAFDDIHDCSEDGLVTPNVRAKRATTVGHQGPG